MQVGRRVINSQEITRGKTHTRRGIAAMWVLLTVPLLLTAFVVMFNAGNLWLASYEAQKAYEAGALAAVQQWGENPNNAANRLIARNRGVDLAQANTAMGNAIAIPDNNDGTNDVNDNDSPDGFIVLGTLRSAVGGYEFNSDLEPVMHFGWRFSRVGVRGRQAS
ncbi:MAG: pilus assembly protein TadG-related protein, partial [Planctomycetota bacterium]|nr:pilus assembly protein TadG-related protein [Planctomycetota bacterium]MDA1215064.1 pilus assembly protein TadG-related protein [Planctomycetota bacterium]